MQGTEETVNARNNGDLYTFIGQLFRAYCVPSTELGARNTDEQSRKCPFPGGAGILQEKQAINNTTYDVISTSAPFSEKKQSRIRTAGVR